MQRFGMVNVELEGQNGQPLNINKAATLEVAVPSALSNTAPSSIIYFRSSYIAKLN